MSAIGCIVSRGQKALDDASADQLNLSLSHYGSPQVAAAAGHQLLIWPSVAEHTNRLFTQRGDYLFGFCGRINNRRSLARNIDWQSGFPDHQEDNTIPLDDVDIASALFLDGGAEALHVIQGGFILLVLHRPDNRLTLIRDPLGDQPLYFWLDTHRLIAASEPAAVLRASGRSPEPDPVRITAWLENRWPAIDNSFFQGIRELRPGHQLETGPRHHMVRRYWSLPASVPYADADPQTVHEAFRETLREVVSDCVADQKEIALSLSGGLDSSSIAASLPGNTKTQAYSWTFEGTPAHNERSSVDLIGRHLGLDVHYMPGDAAACRFDEQVHVDGITPDSPHVNTVYRLKQLLYTQAQRDGNQVILVGDSADELYLGRHYWLRDLLRYRGLSATSALPGALSRLMRGEFEAWLPIRLLAGDRFGLRRHLPQRKAPWLSEETQQWLTPSIPSPAVPQHLQSEVGYDYAIGHYRAAYMTYELGQLARIGIERRSPYRDRRLVELMLGLPAWYYARPPRSKVVVREALEAQLPMSVIAADKQGSLSFLTEQALVANRERLVDYLTNRTGWQEYLNRPMILDAIARVRLSQPGETVRDSPVPYGVLWNTICLQNWFDLLEEWPGAKR